MSDAIARRTLLNGSLATTRSSSSNAARAVGPGLQSRWWRWAKGSSPRSSAKSRSAARRWLCRAQGADAAAPGKLTRGAQSAVWDGGAGSRRARAAAGAAAHTSRSGLAIGPYDRASRLGLARAVRSGLVSCVGPAAGRHFLHGVLDLFRGHVALAGCHRPAMAEGIDDHAIAVAPKHVRHRHS